MCGYCAEHCYFNALAEEVKESGDPEILAELKEFKTGDHPYSYLHRLEQGKEVKLNEITSVSLVQLYEHYLDKGFDQQLIGQIQSLESNAKESEEMTLDDLLEEYYKESKQYPEIPSLLRKLYVFQVLQHESYWNDFIRDKGLPRACIELLTHYAKWWLKGAENTAKTFTAEELDKLSTLFPLLSFSLSWLMRVQAECPVIAEIAFNNVQRVPFFFAPDLWLQRKAFIHCLLQQGLAKTLKQVIEKETRIELLWHVIILLKLSKSDIDLITNTLKANPQLHGSDGNTDDYLEKIKYYLA